jgi:SAM-dependent methyltransferase
MTERTATEAAEPFDFYAAHYARFDSPLSARLRQEVYGEDLGQTGWRTATEQAEIAQWLELRPGVRLLDVCCGSGGPSLSLAERIGCHVTGLDVEPVGVERAKAAAAARGLTGRTAFLATDCGGRLPFADGSLDAALCIDAINHLPDRPGTLREWARLLKTGGRLLYTDPCVLTGPVAKSELDVRAALGFYLFVPPGHDEVALPAAGLTLLSREDRTAACADIATRWHAFRERHREDLQPEEGEAWYAQRQRFLATTAALAGSGRLSRVLYVAAKSADA